MTRTTDGLLVALVVVTAFAYVAREAWRVVARIRRADAACRCGCDDVRPGG